MPTCLQLLAALCTILRVHGAAIGGSNNDLRYRVFVTEGPLVPVLSFSAPRVEADVQELSHYKMPLMLCGASILSKDSLLTSIRCAPSVASRTEVYVFPASTTHFLTNLTQAHVLRHVVTRVDFKSEFTTTSGKKLRNVAVVHLNNNYFSADKNILNSSVSTSTPLNTNTEAENITGNIEVSTTQSSSPQAANFELNPVLTQLATQQITTEAPFIEENYEILDYKDYADFDEDENTTEGNVQSAGVTLSLSSNHENNTMTSQSELDNQFSNNTETSMTIGNNNNNNSSWLSNSTLINNSSNTNVSQDLSINNTNNPNFPNNPISHNINSTSALENNNASDANTQVMTDGNDNNAAGLPDTSVMSQITPEDVLNLTTVIIDLATLAQESEHPSTSESPISGDLMTTTPLCTLREEYEFKIHHPESFDSIDSFLLHFNNIKK